MDAFLFLTVATIVWCAAYLISCAFHPYVDCGSCKRSGESRSGMNKRAFGPCRRCKGAGKRLRIGARLIGRKA